MIREISKTKPDLADGIFGKDRSKAGLARLTLEIRDRYQFVEAYEIGWPGKEIELYFTNTWTRIPALSD